MHPKKLFDDLNMIDDDVINAKDLFESYQHPYPHHVFDVMMLNYGALVVIFFTISMGSWFVLDTIPLFYGRSKCTTELGLTIFNRSVDLVLALFIL